MIKSQRTVNLFQHSYFRFVGVAFLFAVMVLQGCDSKPKNGGLGSIAGMAQLSTPDGATGHAGILMFLAGTPFYARTDQQGRYRMDGIPAGGYDLYAERNGFQTQVISGVQLNADEHGVDSPLNPPVAILQTTAESQQASATLAGAPLGAITGRVWLKGMDENENGGVRVEVDGTGFVTVSSNNGQYRILNVDPGTYSLSYFREGYRAYTTENVEISTGVMEMPDTALELVQPGDAVSPASAAAAAAVAVASTVPPEPAPGPDDPRSIVGQVEAVDETGAAVTDFSEITVAINGTDVVAQINEQGQFRIDGLTSGTYTLIATMDGSEVTQVPVDLEGQRTASVVVKLAPKGDEIPGSGSITGVVVLLDGEGQPMADSSGVQVVVNGTQSLATTAADGSFTLKDVAAGTYTVAATRETHEAGQVANVEVVGLTPVDVGEIRMAMKLDRPRVLSTVPASGSRDVAVGFSLPISVKFSQKMNADSVREAISLSPSTPFRAVMGNGAGDGASDDTLVILLSNESAKSPIQFGATYRVTIRATAANMDGVTMAEDYTLNFQTANPGVIKTTPEDGATRIYLDQNQNPVLINFNTQLDPNTVNERNIRVRPDGGLSVSTTYTNSETNGWSTVRLATTWQADTVYTVTVTSRVKAANGQRLGNTPYTIKFRTAPMEIMTVPALTVR